MGIVKEGTLRLDQIEFDESSYPREAIHSDLIEDYQESILNGDVLPGLDVEVETNGGNKHRLLGGAHRFFARRELAKTIKNTDLHSVSVTFHEIPEDISPKVYAGRLNMTNGREMTFEEIKVLMIEDYESSPRPITKIAAEWHISRKTASKYLKDAIEAWEAEKLCAVEELTAQGLNSTQISEEVQKRWPRQNGLSRQSIDQLMPEKGTVPDPGKEPFAMPEVSIERSEVGDELIVTVKKLLGLPDHLREEIEDYVEGIQAKIEDICNYGEEKPLVN